MLDGGRLVAEGTPDELKRMVPGGHIRLEFSDAQRARPGRAVPWVPTSRDEETLALQVPSDGGVGSLRSLLDRLDAAAIEVDSAVGPHARPRRRLPVPHRPPRPPEKVAAR